ncbi:hypothetical protein DAEQUDRAFT_765382 [Daedalea quercina L-15889]|uniref:Uncharacterized protein n=1 Tax=Daedalea quercina L-15889 TaxID=1314783 RepID=A0A165QJ46_9APHY|nr:hypothetical protein DAEQUDRAFT_765382 [Daedalea quercina L-15889]
MSDAEDEDMGDNELDQLIEDFREWKHSMKTLMDDLEGQLDELQEDFSTMLHAIPRDIVAV